MDHSCYAHPVDRILYVASRLQGDPWSAIKTKIGKVWRNRTDPGQWPEGWDDYEDVFDALDEVYVVVDTVEEATRDFDKLRMEGNLSNFANFIAVFNRLADDSGQTPHQRVAALKKKVSSELFSKLGTHLHADRPQIDDVPGWINLFRGYALTIDEARNHQNNVTVHKPASTSAPKAPAGDPMQLDAMLAAATLAAMNSKTPATDAPPASGTAPARTSSPRGPLSVAEKARRRAGNLCMYCGAVGHYAAICPNRRSQTVSQTVSPPDGQEKA